MTKKNQTKYLGTRVTEREFSAFARKAKRSDLEHSVILREMINAYVENRLTIKPALRRIIK